MGSLLPGLAEAGPGRPGEPTNLQQVMSPTCVKDSLTFGKGSAPSGSQLMVREAASKRYKEGPAKVEEKVNLSDIKKEVKEEVAKEFKDECAEYFNQFHKAAKEEIENNKKLLAELVKNQGEKQEEWQRLIQGNHQGLQT